MTGEKVPAWEALPLEPSRRRIQTEAVELAEAVAVGAHDLAVWADGGGTRRVVAQSRHVELRDRAVHGAGEAVLLAAREEVAHDIAVVVHARDRHGMVGICIRDVEGLEAAVVVADEAVRDAVE